MGILDLIALLIFLAALFTYLNVRYLRLPSTIGLMALSLLVSLSIILIGVMFPSVKGIATLVLRKYDFSEVLLNVMLSFLLFAGAIHVNVGKLSEEKWAILGLATIGTLISTFMVAGMCSLVFPYLGIDIPFIDWLLFGALISPTDPIAVLAILKKMQVSHNLQVKIEGESLFNDGVGVIVFLTLMHLVQSGSGEIHAWEVTYIFITEVFGGLILGAILGYLGLYVLNQVNNAHVELEVLVTLALVTGGNRLAELFHFSSPLAVVVLGLFISREGKVEYLRKVTGNYVYKFWHVVDEAMNAMLFILIGFEILIITISLHWFLAGILAIVVALLARFISVSIPIVILRLNKPNQFGRLGTAQILTWGGLRGGISVALALSLPLVVAKDLIICLTYTVVVFSILVQGMSIGRFIQYVEKRRALTQKNKEFA